MNKDVFTTDIIFQWQKHYQKKDVEKSMLSCNEDKVIRPYFLKYLPKRGVILEAGCGFGHWINYLNKLGYNLMGVEIVRECVEKCKKLFPEINIEQGDVRDLKYPDNYFSGYISIGVLEHFIEGPEKAISEVKRVLVKNGIAIFTVPSFNVFLKIFYPIRKFFIEIFRYNNLLRIIVGKHTISKKDVVQFKLKEKEIKTNLRKEFWPIVGVIEDSGPVFIEYKYKKNQLDKFLRNEKFEILESVSIKHPMIFRDIFGGIVFRNEERLEFNIVGKIIYKLTDILGVDFFSYVYLVVARVKK